MWPFDWQHPAEHFSRIDPKPLVAHIGHWPTGALAGPSDTVGDLSGRAGARTEHGIAG